MQPYRGNVLRALGGIAVIGAAVFALTPVAYGQSQAESSPRSPDALNVYMKGNTVCEEIVVRPDGQFTGICDTTYADGLKIRRNTLSGAPFLRVVISPEGETLHRVDIITPRDKVRFRPEFDAVLKDVVQPEYCMAGRCKGNK